MTTGALGLLRAFTEAGVKVPDDVSVVGFDDQPEAGYFTPPLTTVRQDFEEIGRRSVHMVLDAIDGAADPVARATITPELIMRESSGPAS